MKHNPNQTKTVVILSVVLAGAIVFVFMRLSGGEVSQAAVKQPAVEQKSDTTGGVQVAATRDLARDPFNKPAVFRAALDTRDAVEARILSADNTAPNPYAGRDAPIDLTADLAVTQLPTSDASKASNTEPKPANEKSKPRFELLATVKGSGGWSAVIKTAESVVRVVDVNDIVGSGFKVVRIETERAVLTDGRITVIAKRPGS